jgi:hypothetical protein
MENDESTPQPITGTSSVTGLRATSSAEGHTALPITPNLWAYIGCIALIGALVWLLLPACFVGVAQGILANAVCFATLMILVPVRDALIKSEAGRKVLKATGIMK